MKPFQYGKYWIYLCTKCQHLWASETEGKTFEADCPGCSKPTTSKKDGPK